MSNFILTKSYSYYEIDFSNNQIKYYFSNSIILEFSDIFVVYYKEVGPLVQESKKYLNQATTQREFENFEDAMYYVEYLKKLIKYKQFEQCFYFENIVTELDICKNIVVGLYNNDVGFYARINIYGLNYIMLIVFDSSYNFELCCYPNNDDFEKEKKKQYSSIDDLFTDLEKFTSFYDSIPFDEVDRDVF